MHSPCTINDIESTHEEVSELEHRAGGQVSLLASQFLARTKKTNPIDCIEDDKLNQSTAPFVSYSNFGLLWFCFE